MSELQNNQNTEELIKARRAIDNSGAIEVLLSAKLLIPRTEVVLSPGKLTSDRKSYYPPFVGLKREQMWDAGNCYAGVWVYLQNAQDEDFSIENTAARSYHHPLLGNRNSTFNMSMVLPKPVELEKTMDGQDKLRIALKGTIEIMLPYLEDPNAQLPMDNPAWRNTP